MKGSTTMKKILLFLLLSIFALGDIDIVPDDSLGKSIFYTVLVSLTPSIVSDQSSKESSKESSPIKEKETAEETYDYYKKLAENKIVRAGEVFTEAGLEKLELKNEKIVELSETNVGILVMDGTRNLALITSKSEYDDLIYRALR